MKQIGIFLIALVGFFGAASGAQAIKGGDGMDPAKECFFIANPKGDWQNAIPSGAKKINFEFGQLIDLDTVAERPGACMDEAAVYVSFSSPVDQTLDFGLGADWWSELYLNGRLCCSTMENGNGLGSFAVSDNPFPLPVRAGKNLLAVKVRRGSESWKLVCGPTEYKPYAGKIPWEKGAVLPPPRRQGKNYRLIVLGDLHFDTDPEVYHADYNEPNARLNKIQRAEFARNAEMWKERNPRMMAAAASQITPDTLAVIQVGDLIQGDCGNPAVHAKMLLDTLRMLKKEFKGLPVLTVTGNHDVRGKGAGKAYHTVMPEYLSGELKQPVKKMNFSAMIGGDLFLFIDFNDPDFEFIKKALKQNARYKFVVCHGPVLPSDCASCRWFLYGQSDPWRRITHQLFMQEDVIVLTGHVHDLELTECVTTEGRITQLMANSVWSSGDLAEARTIFSRPDEYGKLRKSPGDRKLFGEYQNVITRYWKAGGAGYFVLDVGPDGITAKYFGGASTVPSKTINLR